MEGALIKDLAGDGLPRSWNAPLLSSETQLIGDEWARAAREPVLRVPSAIVSGESNFLLNPLHPDFPKIRIEKPRCFSLDPRLLKTVG